MIEAAKLCVVFRDQTILDGVSFSLRPGELVTVLAPNGAGKSTLLKCLAGTLKPQCGSVQINARPIEDYPIRELARRRAVLSQHHAVQFPFTVLGVARLGRYPHDDLPDARNQAIAEEALRKTEVWHLRHRLFPTLSGGEQQRVQLARVLAQIWETPGAFLLLDEPTSALDLKHQQRTLDLARELAEDGMGVLCIMHDLNLAALYADRVILMQNGRIAATGLPEEVLRQDALESVFGIRANVALHPLSGRPSIMLAVAHSRAEFSG